MMTSPEIFSILKKLAYPEWPHRPVEKFFIAPLLKNFNIMRANLTKLYTMGFEYWRLPLGQNEIFLKDVIELCKREKIANRILGTPFLRFTFIINLYRLMDTLQGFLNLEDIWN